MKKTLDAEMWQGWVEGNNKIIYVEEDLNETPDSSFIDRYIEEELDKAKQERSNYVYLSVLADKLEADRSCLRRFILRHKIPMVKIKGIGFYNNVLNLALTQENAKKVIELKLGTPVVKI